MGEKVNTSSPYFYSSLFDERNMGFEMNEDKFISKCSKLLLAAAMVFSVIMIMPKDVGAAADWVLPPGGGAIAVSDQECTVMVHDYNWISYTAAKDGYLRLSFSNNTKSKIIGQSYGNVCLYDAGKSVPLSGVTRYDTSETTDFMTSEYYGVKKGTTYKIRINSIGGVKINASFKAISKKLNKNLKKKKAITLKKKKQIAGIIQPGSMKSHFYKFKVTKGQVIRVTIQPYLTSDCYLIFSGSHLEKSKRRIYMRSEKSQVYPNAWGNKCTYTISSANGKASAGTYYLEVKPIGKVCNGYYKISWK